MGEQRRLSGNARRSRLQTIHGGDRGLDDAGRARLRRRFDGSSRHEDLEVTAGAAPAAHVEEAEAIVRHLLTDPVPDPYPLYARLREIDPIHRAAVGDFWTLTRYHDIYSA